MSLASWALVMAHHREPDNAPRRLHLSADGELRHARACCWPSACWPARTAATPSPRSAPRHPAAALAALVLVLVLIGAGSKAGLVPLHVWLPLAHPAAPSHVSALMSGVMTKVAVYGFIRIVFDLLGRAELVVGRGRAGAGRRHRGAGRALRADGARSEAAARLSHGREYRHHLHRPRPGAGVPRQRHGMRRRRWR